MSGILYIVATPIGNLGDISFRAREVLAMENLRIYSESPQKTARLLEYLGIDKTARKYCQHSDDAVLDNIVTLIGGGVSVAYVSEAGTPGISDPGGKLVRAVRERFGGDFVKAVPGASALASAISVAGFKVHPFVFWGFLPTKKGRQKMIDVIVSERDKNHVIYESRHRVIKFLNELKARGYDGEVNVFKELSKMNERVFGGDVDCVLNMFMSEPGLEKGEFTIILRNI